MAYTVGKPSANMFDSNKGHYPPSRVAPPTKFLPASSREPLRMMKPGRMVTRPDDRLDS